MKRRTKQSATAKRSRLPPCAPRKKRIRIDAEPFCARTQRYCKSDPLGSSYELGTRRPKWDSRLVLVIGIVGLLIWSDSLAKDKEPSQLGPGERSPLPRPTQPNLPGIDLTA